MQNLDQSYHTVEIYSEYHVYYYVILDNFVFNNIEI